VADPLFPNPSDADWIIGQQRQAQSSALQGLDANPDDGARAIELGKSTGTDPALVYGNLDQFEQQHKAALTSQLLSSNKFLRDYAGSHPMAPVVSSDDWGQLDEISHRLHFLGPTATGILSAPTDTAESAVKGFYKAFTEQGRFGKAIAEQPPDWARDYPFLWNNLARIAQTIGVLPEAVNRTISGALEGGGAAVETGAQRMGASPEAAAQIKEAALGTAETLMQMGMTGEIPHVEPGEGAVKKAAQDSQNRQAAELYRKVKPYLEQGVKPPIGLDKVIDDIYADQAKQDIGNLGDTVKEIGKSTTKERAPELLENFVAQHTDASVDISAEAVRKLYGDKPPTEDDGILGFIPDLGKQLEAAETYGGDVEVPLSAFLARVEPDVFKALQDDIRFRKGGMTLNEAKLEKGEEKPAPIDSVDAIRRSAGLDPIAAPGQMRLTRVEPEEGVPGHSFDIEDPQGKRIGGATIVEKDDGQTLIVTHVAAGTTEGLPGFLGPRQLSGLLRQLQVEFPRAEFIEGWRISGAGPERKASIPLRPTPKQTTDFLRTGETHTVWDYNHNTFDVQPLHSTTLGEVLSKSAVESSTDSPIMKHFGETITRLAKDVPVHVISQEDMARAFVGSNAGGFHQLYKDGTNKIFIREDVTEWQPHVALHVLMHEGSHAITVAQIEKFPEIKASIRGLMNEVDAFRKLNPKLFEFQNYAFTNEKEFIAEAMSKEGFQKVLQSTPISKELISDLGLRRASTVWDAVRNIVQDLWERLTGKAVPKTAMDAVFSLSKDIEALRAEAKGKGKVSTDAIKDTQLELPGLTRMEDREAFDKAADVGMKVKEYRQYQEKIRQQAEEDMEKFRLDAEKRERLRQTTEWKTMEAQVKKEVRERLLGRPDIAADNLLREGSYLGDKLPGRVRLDSDKLSAEQKAGLPEDYLKPGGMNPDDAATQLGYPTAQLMLDGLKQLHAERGKLGPREHFNKVVEKITQDRMSREFGDLEQQILEEAKDHVVSQTQLDILHQETIALAKNTDELPFTKAKLKEGVKRVFGETPISAHSVDKYLASAGRAGRATELALLDGDFKEAFKFKQQQYISMLMANEAKAYEKLRKATDKITDRVANPKYNGMDKSYLAHLRDIVGNAGLKTGKSIQGLEDDVRAAKPLAQFVESESNMKAMQILLPDWIYAGEKIPLDKMTYEQFKGFSDAVMQLYKLGREDKVYTTRAGKVALREVIENQAIPQLAKQGKTGTPYNVQGIGKLTGAVKDIVYGKLIQNFSVFNRWDLGDKHGFFNMNVVYPAMSAASELSARIKEYGSKLDDAFKGIKDVNLKAPLPNLLKRVSRNEMVNMTMENLQRIIMDMGNPNNMDKFVRGWKVDKDQLWAYLKEHSTKEMWDTWQKVGDINKEAFADLREMIRDQNGVVPDLVELHPFEDPHGVMREGWYSPMIYDQKELGTSRAAEGLSPINPESLGGLFDTGYFKSTTATGSEIRRTSYAAPTDLTLNRLPQRMSQILYDTSFRPFVTNFGKMLRDTEFRHAIERHSGEAVLHMMDDWLRDIIGGGKGVSTVSDQMLGRISEFFRRNMIGTFIGWNIRTAEKHGPTAALNSVAEVGPINFAREVKSLFATSPDGFTSNFNFALSKSLELQRRFQTIRETLGGRWEGLQFQNKGFWAARDWMLEKGGFLVGWSDMMSSVPSWLAEYKKQMAELGEKFPNKLPQEYEGTAIEIANSIVLRAHGSTAITARPGIMRGNAMSRLFTSLYSVFNQMLQRQFEAYWRTKYAKDNYKEADFAEIRGHLGKAALLVATSTLWPVMVEHMVTPDPEKKKQGWLGKTAEYLAEGATLGIPVAREMVHGFLTSGEGGAGMLDSELKTVASSLMDVTKSADDKTGIPRITKMMDKEHGGKTIKDFTSLIGLATGVPGEAGNILEAGWNAMHGSKQAPRSPAETYRALTTGKAIGQPDLIQHGIEAVTKEGRRK
jgi:hypothetical protein